MDDKPNPQELIDRLAASADDEKRRKLAEAIAHAAEREVAARKRRKWGPVAGAAFAFALSFLMAEENHWLFPLLMLLAGGGSTALFMKLKVNHLVAMVLYGGSGVVISGACAFAGLIQLQALFMVFSWLFLLAFGAGIAFWAEMDRQNDVPF
jgi:hypothetical protein